MRTIHTVHKLIGETPLQALERYRHKAGISEDVPMTYAGRLDPMAEGLLLILSHTQCKAKEQFLSLDKTYQASILLGCKTDSFDILGKVISEPTVQSEQIQQQLKSLIGSPMLQIPPFASVPVDGKPLQAWAREGVMKYAERKMQIVSIEDIEIDSMGGSMLFDQIQERIQSVKGDFRQEEIIERWREVIDKKMSYKLVNFTIDVASGAYIRSIANTFGGTLFSLKRVRVGSWK